MYDRKYVHRPAGADPRSRRTLPWRGVNDPAEPGFAGHKPRAARGVRHQAATAHELARIAELAGLPGEALARLGEQMERRELAPGEALDAAGRFGVVLSGMVRGKAGLLRPGETFAESVAALTPATVASCERAVYESFVASA
jgi:hypothetical protein